MKNQELKDIENVITLLTVFKQYSINSNNLYDDLKVTTIDIDKKIKDLQDIHCKYMAEKKLHSEKSNAWNKTHKERHNEINKAYNRRKKEGK